MGPKYNDKCPYKRYIERGEGHVRVETEIEPQARNAWKLKRQGSDPPLEPWEGVWPSQHLDFLTSGL